MTDKAGEVAAIGGSRPAATGPDATGSGSPTGITASEMGDKGG